MAFKVACVQFAPVKAEVEKNLDTISDIVVQAESEGADLILFPEASTSGYFLEGGVLESSLTSQQLVSGLSNRLQHRLAGEIDVVLGFYENHEGTLYNSSAYVQVGNKNVKLIGVYRKFFLPTYGVFDEERFVTRGRDLGVFETRFGKVAVLICEDVWHGVLPTLCAVNGAQLILVPAASPGRGFSGSDVDNHDRYRRLFRGISEEHGVFCASAQLCGFEGGKGFIGGSMIVDPFGKVLAEGPLAQEFLLLADIDPYLVAISRAQSPLLSDLQSAWEDVRRLVARSEF